MNSGLAGLRAQHAAHQSSVVRSLVKAQRSSSFFLPGWAGQLMFWVGWGLAWAKQLGLGKGERMVKVLVLLRVVKGKQTLPLGSASEADLLVEGTHWPLCPLEQDSIESHNLLPILFLSLATPYICVCVWDVCRH